jgi:hypothetical protein
MSYKLSGFDRDTVKAAAIHQDYESLWAYIEALVDKQAGKPLPANPGLTLTDGETQMVTALRVFKAE